MSERCSSERLEKPAWPGAKPREFSSKAFQAGVRLRVGVLSNPLSGGNRKGLKTVRAIIGDDSHTVHHETETPAHVAWALTDFARQEVDIVAVNGGDGTIQAALTALFHHHPFERPPLLALLRSGTDSIIARDAGIRGSSEQGLRRLLTWTRTRNGGGFIRKRPVMRLQTAVDEEPLYGMIFGAALAYEGIRYCRRRIHTLGLTGEMAPGLTVARFLLAVARGNKDYTTPVPITLGLDQNPPQKQHFLLVVITTLDRLFVGLRPFWGSENGPLHFTAIGARPGHLLRVLPFLARGRKCRHGTPENGYFSHNVHKARLTLNSGFTLDGELHRPDPRGKSLEVKYGGQASFLVL